jgi:hypothetical protein
MVDPPLDEGAFHERLTWLSPADAPRFCGAPGIVADAKGVAVAPLLGGPWPMPLTALTM